MRITRTLEEIKAHYGNLKATHAAYVPDMEVKRETLEIWKLLDHIATLEAQNAALQAQLAEAKEEILCWEVNGEGPD